MRLAVVSTKGGTGKTTSSIYLATGLHQLGRTLLADTDPQSSAFAWSHPAGEPVMPFPVISLPSRNVAATLAEVGQAAEHWVIDTPPGDLAIIAGAVKAAEVVLVPVSPSGLDLARIRPTFELLAELVAVRPVEVGVVLTRVRTGTRSARDARAILAEFEYPVMDTEIPQREAMAAAYGACPADLGRYADLLTELKG